MNKYQLIIYWTTIFIITITIFPLFYFVFEFEVLNGIIISVIITVIIWGTSLFLSLKQKDEERLKETWGLIKKFIFTLGSIAIIFAIYFAIQLIINFINEKDYKDKKQLLQQHIQQEFWFANNLILSKGQLRFGEDRSYPSYKVLKELTFIIENKSPIDVSRFTLKLTIYDSQDNIYEEKEIFIWKSISSDTRVKIEEPFFPPETNMVPTNFKWSYGIKSADISFNYLSEHSLDQIESFIDADSLSFENPIQKLLYSIDWDTVDVN